MKLPSEVWVYEHGDFYEGVYSTRLFYNEKAASKYLKSKFPEWRSAFVDGFHSSETGKPVPQGQRFRKTKKSNKYHKIYPQKVF